MTMTRTLLALCLLGLLVAPTAFARPRPDGEDEDKPWSLKEEKKDGETRIARGHCWAPPALAPALPVDMYRTRVLFSELAQLPLHAQG